MKKLILLMILLTACSGPTVVEESNACSPDYTYPQSTSDEWNGIQFQRPWCWYDIVGTEGSTDGILRMEQGEGEAWVEFSQLNGVYDGPAQGYMRSDEEGYSTFNFQGEFILKTDVPDHSDVQLIINSIALP